MEIETKNDFLIGGNGEHLSAMLPVHITTREQAFRTAAWISALGMMLPSESDKEGPSFEEVREAIFNT